jgi:hypothetical protein
MNEIYWLTRLGVMGKACEVVSILGIVVLVVGVLILPLLFDILDDNEDAKKGVKKAIRTSFVIWIVGLIGYIFIPTQKEMVMIYGLGSTIDYIKSNDKAKQLPDKAVDALTKYLEDINKDEKE